MISLKDGLKRALLCSFLLLQSVLSETPGQLRPRSTSEATCNGRTEYCTRSFSNISFVGSHDSVFVGELPQQNQNINITAQLNMGIRFLQAQTHRSIFDKKLIELCHTSCILEDAGTLLAFLHTVKTWLDANPNEVVTLLLTNGDSLAVSLFGDTFSKSGISDYAFVPSSNPLAIDNWPTLGDLILNGTRLVVFLDYGANVNTVNYILPEFQYYFETPYDVTDRTFSNCSIDRPAGASASGLMYIVNHFLDLDIFGIDIPAREAASSTNAATGEGSLGAQASECEALYNREPNVMLADFVDKGNVIEAQNQLNGFL